MSRRGSKKRFYCGHCDEYLCKTMFFEHKRLHFNKETNQWLSSSRIFSTSSSSAAFSGCPSFCPSTEALTNQLLANVNQLEVYLNQKMMPLLVLVLSLN